MSIDTRIGTYYQNVFSFIEREECNLWHPRECSPELRNYIFRLFGEVTGEERVKIEEMFDAMSARHKGYLYFLLHAGFRLQKRQWARPNPEIKRVIFHDPATIVFWRDGSKTVVKAENEPYDPEKGLAMAIAKHALGNEGNYYNHFRKWLPKKGEENT